MRIQTKESSIVKTDLRYILSHYPSQLDILADDSFQLTLLYESTGRRQADATFSRFWFHYTSGMRRRRSIRNRDTRTRFFFSRKPQHHIGSHGLSDRNINIQFKTIS